MIIALAGGDIPAYGDPGLTYVVNDPGSQAALSAAAAAAGVEPARPAEPLTHNLVAPDFGTRGGAGLSGLLLPGILLVAVLGAWKGPGLLLKLRLLRLSTRATFRT